MGSPYSEVTQACSTKGFDDWIEKHLQNSFISLQQNYSSVRGTLSWSLQALLTCPWEKSNSPWHSNSKYPRGEGLQGLWTMLCSALLLYFLSGLMNLTLYSATHLAEELFFFFFLRLQNSIFSRLQQRKFVCFKIK